MVIIIEQIVWDEWNVAHIARHQVTPGEVEEVVWGEPLAGETYAGRLRLIGLTREGRMLTVILAPKGAGMYYTVTARVASKKERVLYREWKGGEQAA